MRHITADQFMELPDEVQKVFVNWWEPSPWDLVQSEKYGIGQIRPSDLRGLDEHTLKIIKERNIPLFRLDQLIEFVQEEYPHVGVNNFISKDEYSLKLFKNMMQFEPSIEVIEQDLIQAVWKVAVLVAKEKVEVGE